MGPRGWTRRRLLQAGTGVAFGATAGCLRFQQGSEEGTPANDGTGTPGGAPGTDTPEATGTPAATASQAVRQIHSDAANTGYDPDATGPYDAVEDVWTVDDGQGAPAVVGDRIFATAGSDVVAVDEFDGERLWETRVLIAAPGPATVDGTVYASGGNDALNALSAESGDGLWSKGTVGEPMPPTIAGDAIYLASGTPEFDEGSVVAVNRTDGEERWDADLETPVMGPPAVADDTVYANAVADSETTLYALDAASGDVQWSETVSGAANNAPVVADGTVYLGCEQLFAFDAGDGSQQWSTDVSSLGVSPAVAHGSVFTGGEGEFVAVDAASGERQWTYENEHLDVVTGSPAVAGDTVYFGADTGFVGALAVEDATERFTTIVVGAIDDPLVVANGRLYVGDGNGLTAYEEL